MSNFSNDQENSPQQNQMPVSSEYTEWRRLILNMPPKAALKNIADEIYGILMDVGMGDNYGNFMAISIYAFHTGEASLKASSGAGVLGLGNTKKIAGLPKKIIETAQPLIGLTKTADNLDYPKAQQVRFFFLTTSGVRAYECKIEDLREGHPFLETFNSFTFIKGVADKMVTNPILKLWGKVAVLWNMFFGGHKQSNQ